MANSSSGWDSAWDDEDSMTDADRARRQEYLRNDRINEGVARMARAREAHREQTNRGSSSEAARDDSSRSHKRVNVWLLSACLVGAIVLVLILIRIFA